jgi:hypothetical protein
MHHVTTKASELIRIVESAAGHCMLVPVKTTA